MTKFAAALQISSSLSLTRTNLAGIAAATDVSSSALQHAMALRAAIVLFKGQAATTFILSKCRHQDRHAARLRYHHPGEFPACSSAPR